MENFKISHKYLACMQIAIQQQLAEKGQLIGRIFLYAIIVYLFHQVFESVGAPKARIWYLAITEWIILSTPPIALQIAEDCNTGQMAYFLLRPIHYLSLRLAESLGIILVRFFLLGIICLCLCYILTNSIPRTWDIWGVGILFGLIGNFMYTLISILIGLSAFWLKEIKTLLYLNMTATFSFGGLIVPLEFYSPLMTNISFLTPYPWILWWPAKFITEGSMLEYAFFAVIFWILFIIATIILVYRQCMKSFVMEGG